MTDIKKCRHCCITFQRPDDAPIPHDRCERCHEEIKGGLPHTVWRALRLDGSEVRMEAICATDPTNDHATNCTTSAAEILRAGLGHMEDRAETYDKPAGERSMAATVRAFAATTGIELTEEQGWHFMALLKLVRSQQGGLRMDSYEDGAAYFGLMGEAAAKERA